MYVKRKYCDRKKFFVVFPAKMSVQRSPEPKINNWFEKCMSICMLSLSGPKANAIATRPILFTLSQNCTLGLIDTRKDF